jgi:hypothetical protein
LSPPERTKVLIILGYELRTCNSPIKGHRSMATRYGAALSNGSPLLYLKNIV